MKWLLLGLLVFPALVFYLTVGVICAAQGGENFKAGDITLSKDEGLKGAIELSFGKEVTVTSNVFRSTAFGSKVVNANPIIRNTTNELRVCSYYIALFDKEKNLLGCSGQTAEVKGMKDAVCGSCLIRLADDDFEKVSSYQARIVSIVKVSEADKDAGANGGKKDK